MSLRKLLRRLSRSGDAPYDPDRYWESRAAELVDVYDHPETWAERGWMSAGAEEAVVPGILAREAVQSVVVAGAGSGRQYAFLSNAGLKVRGFDISASLVATCRERYPTVPTHVGSVVDADEHEASADAVVTSAVLQHVPPADIERAARALQALAERCVVIRELTSMGATSPYQFVHDYDALFAAWEEIHRETTDERGPVRVELIAWRRPT